MTAQAQAPESPPDNLSDAQRCGWNDIAHGVNDWTPHEQWPTPLDWIKHCRTIAAGNRSGSEYCQGAVKAADHYIRTGSLTRLERRSRRWY